MSNSTNGLPQLASGQAQMEATANKNFAAASPAMTYAIDKIVGSTLYYMEGNTLIAGVPTFIAAGTQALTFSATNYVRKDDSDGTLDVQTSAPTDWPEPNGGYTPLHTIVMGTAAFTSYTDHRTMGGAGASGATFTGGTLTTPINYAPTDTIASATTTDIGASDSNYISISGTTTITGLGTIAAGALRFVTFEGVLTLTHSGTDLILPGGANITTAAGDSAIFVSLGSGDWKCLAYIKANGKSVVETAPPKVIQVAVSDQTTDITTGTAKVTFRMPYAMTLTAVRASLNTVSSSGAPAIDINKTGVGSLLSTTITIDASEKTSATAATPAVISTSALSDDDEITIDIDTAGTGAKGLVVTMIGT